ncbi:MAG: PAS domain S-box protein [Ignavibacteria bacterium]|nr:PAS domain S-box protein [Ignavibacteria bacterium]
MSEKILIVDDIAENIYLLEYWLKNIGYEVIAARNGAEALGLARINKPDMIISDILMPVMDGFSFCREIKKDNALKVVPFIFYTSTYTGPYDIEFGQSLGADRYIIKPEDPELFEQIIRSLLDEVKGKQSISVGIEAPEESVVLKQYNETLIRKLEDKMLEAEENEKKLRSYVKELEDTLKERKKVEAALRISEERYRSLYNNAVFGFYRTTPKGEILLINETLVKILGYESIEEIIGRNVSVIDFLEKGERARFIEYFVTENEVFDLESTWRCKNGHVVHVRENAKAIRNSKGEILYFDGIVEDITEQKRMKDELEESQHLFLTLAQLSPVGIFKTDPSGATTYVNPKWSELSGLSSREAMGDGWLRAVHPEDREMLQQNWTKDTVANHKSTAEYRFLKSDGSLVWVLGEAVPEIMNGKLCGYIGTITNITEQKLHEQRLRFLSRAIEQSPVSVVLTDTAGNIEYVNPCFEEVSGYSSAEVLSKNPRILQSEHTPRELYSKLWETISQGHTWSGEFLNKRKNGELYWEASSISPIVDERGNITNYLGIKVDMTKQKKILEELIAAKETAEEMNKLKSNFLANMSHELRTPLIGILGYSEILLDEISSKECLQMINTIRSSGERLKNTLNMILDLSKVEANQIQLLLGELDISLVISNCVELFAGVAKQKGLYLTVNDLSNKSFALLDNRLFVDIMNNLLKNAVVYTAKGGITVTINKEKVENENWISIAVQDTGIGIDKSNHELIFEEFRQVSEGLSRSFEGSGLGLTLTKKYVDLLGGKIEVQSTLGLGSTFTVKFPVLENQSQK